MGETPEQRVYAIRLALGDGWKSPLPMAAFATLVNKRTKGTRYDSAKISRIESGERKLSIEDVIAFAKVDPKKRGRDWLAWGVETDEGEDFPPEQQGGKKNA